MSRTIIKVDRHHDRPFAGLAARDLARLEHGKRLYRRIALEHRGNAEAAREAGRRARSA